MGKWRYRWKPPVLKPGDSAVFAMHNGTAIRGVCQAITTRYSQWYGDGESTHSYEMRAPHWKRSQHVGEDSIDINTIKESP